MEVDEQPTNYEQMDDESESSSDSSIDSSDSTDSEFLQTFKANANEIRSKVSLNPYDYGAHVELIRHYEDAKSKIQFDEQLYEELREVREFMYKYYPLEPGLWCSWLNDEKEFGQKYGQNNQEYLLGLFERATKDYCSVQVWGLYLQYIIGLTNCSVDVVKVFDRALFSVGLHPVEGAFVWDTYRSYQEILIDFKETEEEKAKQLYSVFELYKRQLSIPHNNIERTFENFQEWMSSNKDVIQNIENNFSKLKFDVEQVEKLYEKSRKELNEIIKFEEKLIESKGSLEVYYEYLDYELKLKRPERIQFLFERTITNHCLILDVWFKYLDYLKSSLNIYDFISTLLDRAVRNIIGCVRFWKEYISLNEKFNKPVEETQAIFERSLEQLFDRDLGEIWLHYLQFKRRVTDFNDSKQVEKLREHFETAVRHLSSNANADPEFRVSIFQAKVESRYCKNIAKSREIWKEIMKFHKNLGNQQIRYWLMYADLEKAHSDLTGDLKHYKFVMLEALRYCPENFSQLSERLIDDFNVECNDRQEIEHVEKRVQDVYNQYVKPHLSKQQAANEEKGVKRKVKDTKLDKSTNKKAKIESQPKPPPASTASKPKLINELETVLASNLDYNIQESEIRSAFSKFGTIKDIRMATRPGGAFKGFCFVEFESTDGARKALENDRFQLRGRPVFISRYNEKKEFVYNKGLEKNKLFVSNLPKSDSYKKDNKLEGILTGIFGKLNGFVALRICELRNGHLNGKAYVDFKTAEDASKALQQTDGLEVGDSPDSRKMRVQISNPPEKDSNKANSVFNNPTLGTTSRGFGGRAKRLQIN